MRGQKLFRYGRFIWLTVLCILLIARCCGTENEEAVLGSRHSEESGGNAESRMDEEVWIWTVNGEVIGRSDELTRKEIDDLIYNENSEWGISGDRWRTIYNQGLTTDYSIYSEP